MAAAKRARAASGATPELNATAASVLGFLLHEPMAGWDLAAKIEEIIGDFWNVTRSQIYRELKMLAEQGLVTSLKAGPRERQPYRVTDAGRKAFHRWIAGRPGPPNMRLPLVLQVFFAEAVDPEVLRASLDELRAYHATRLEAYRGFEQVVKDGTGSHDALQLGIRFQQLMIDWIDSVKKGGKRRA
jgi:DNA-binding PadR family transcriptional regulator